MTNSGDLTSPNYHHASLSFPSLKHLYSSSGEEEELLLIYLMPFARATFIVSQLNAELLTGTRGQPHLRNSRPTAAAAALE